MMSAMLRSARSAVSRTQIHRRGGFPAESELARKLPAPAAAGQPLSLLTKLGPLASVHSVSHIAAAASSATHVNARSEGLVKYSTMTVPKAAAADVSLKAGTYDHERSRPFGVTTLRPLSPHLTIFKPQLNSTVSISNRISAAILVTIVVSSYLMCLKIGGICFTFPSFYQLFFYSSKYLIPVSAEVTALALAFHLFYGIRHLITK